MKLTKLAVLFAAAGLSATAFATDGYFSHGYGMKAKGMGGAATAMASDAFGGANNPASMVWAGGRMDIGVDLFSPKRRVERTGSTAGFIAIDGSADSGSNLFYVPEFGYNKMVGSDMSAGVSVYGNGGMNTNYSGGQIGAASLCAGFNPGGAAAAPFNMLCGTGNLGINLVQLVVAPTFSMKVNKDNSIGVSLLIGYQQFAAQGLDGFNGFTPVPAASAAAFAANNHLSNRGYDNSHGYGLRLGWMGKVSDAMTLGASYTSKMKMSKFDKYKDLFPAEGMFDMPESLNLGIAFRATPAVTIVADYQRINFGGITSIANPSTNGGAATVGTLGCASCRGFGWSSVDVIKLGAEYSFNPSLTLRAGYNHTDNPIQGRDVTFNIIAPGVVQDHATLGFTYGLTKDSELTMAYMHAFKNSVTAPSLFNTWAAPFSAGSEKIQMYQDSLGIAYSLKFQ